MALTPDAAVFACRRVLQGAPILHAAADEEGQVSFLCGDDHSDGRTDPGSLVRFDTLLPRDPSLRELGDLKPYEEAQRKTDTHPWTIHDGYEDIVLENIEEFGWHVVLVPDDEEGPGFAYSIGQEPEVVVFGLEPDILHAIVNAAGEAEAIPVDVPLTGYLEGCPVVFKRVSKERYKDVFGYALWYHEGDGFDALQCVWPDKAGKFPWDPGFRKDLLPLQPPLYATQRTV